MKRHRLLVDLRGNFVAEAWYEKRWTNIVVRYRKWGVEAVAVLETNTEILNSLN